MISFAKHCNQSFYVLLQFSVLMSIIYQLRCHISKLLFSADFP